MLAGHRVPQEKTLHARQVIHIVTGIREGVDNLPAQERLSAELASPDRTREEQQKTDCLHDDSKAERWLQGFRLHRAYTAREPVKA